ncbi:MAG: threonine synthase [Oscillospiraceae bacterium]|nr:threonine synthase [Oscillospiraceae bacterium]MBQ7802098.1 threonine synthase [Oscillospiraceae bacterium]
MFYHSTRNANATVDSARAVLEGLAPDGGLYMPEAIPAFDWRQCLTGSSQEMATQILSALLPDIPDMRALVSRAYTGKFQTEDLTPTVKVGPYTVLELFRGPTSAFKDVALSMLPQLLTAAKDVCGQEREIMILTATSGDTGKAALAGFRDVPGVKITVFFPDGGVSAVQRAQMVTQEGNNVTVCAVRGNFDDAQTGVKNIFAACQGRTPKYELSSANSINIGRLAPQVMYYFKAYRDLLDRDEIALGDQVNFSVPTGNFGDILAGYLAKLLGLPVGMLICASNANNVLTDFIRTGTYDKRRPLLKTTSPSMDILVSSNLERTLYLLSGCDCALVADLMKQLNTEGVYTVPADLKAAMDREFWAGCCDDAGAAAVIGKVWKEQGYLMDTHTAAGWAAAEEYVSQTGDKRPMVVLSTASPYKFPAAVLEAIGGDTSGDEFTQMERLEAVTGVPTPKNLSGLRGKQELHPGVIDKDKMLEFVLGL